MNRKEVRAWLKEHEDVKKKADELRKELESKDLPGLLALVSLSQEGLAAIKTVVIAEILRERGLLDQTKKG